MTTNAANGSRPAGTPRLAASVTALVLLLAVSGCGVPNASEPAKEAEPARPAPALGERVAAGDKFPAAKVRVLRPGGDETEDLDLGAELGKRPIVFVYFMLGHSISEQILGEVSHFVDSELSGKVGFHPVVRLGIREGVSELGARMTLLGIKSPVILDSDGVLQKTLGAGVVPHITLIDSEGYVDFAGATSLKQPVLGDVDVRKAIRIAAGGEQPPSVFGLMKYHPASDFVGEKFMDFELKDYKTGASVRFSKHVGPGKVAGILYWSPKCPYTRKAMPGVVAGYRQFAGHGLDLISVVRDGSDEDVDAYAKAQGITFPILRDPDKNFTSLYRVVATPTLILIGPDGTVDSVYTTGKINYYPVFATKIKTLVQAPKPAG